MPTSYPLTKKQEGEKGRAGNKDKERMGEDDKRGTMEGIKGKANPIIYHSSVYGPRKQEGKEGGERREKTG